MAEQSESSVKDKKKRPIREFIFDQIGLINTTVAPGNPIDGMIVYTDGVSWNPGSGQGIYARYNSTWNKL